VREDRTHNETLFDARPEEATSIRLSAHIGAESPVAVYCEVMKRLMAGRDRIISQPKSGHGASLVIHHHSSGPVKLSLHEIELDSLAAFRMEERRKPACGSMRAGCHRWLIVCPRSQQEENRAGEHVRHLRH